MDKLQTVTLSLITNCNQLDTTISRVRAFSPRTGGCYAGAFWTWSGILPC